MNRKNGMFKSNASDQQSKIEEFCEKSNDDIIEGYDNDDEFKEFYREVKKIAKSSDPRMIIPETPNTSSSHIKKEPIHNQTMKDKVPPSPAIK